MPRCPRLPFAALALGVLGGSPLAAQVTVPSRQAEACTMEFRMLNLRVLGPDGAPAGGATITLLDAKRGTPFGVTPQDASNGNYTLLDDSAVQLLEGKPKALRLVITHPAGRATTRWVVAPTAGDCHIEKRRGPDVVKLKR